ncbi:lysozyme C, milk isozyme-like [Sceloporus undulatus]|uniref:lysozyme C, milk isozyme-like n=1 Tax=Sceloporus undulatus TaxID=8520 RepID=UPI001C4B8404|nr:lysozyme C, milk isozyme-like [Sceloporus undulatus]
MVSHIIQEGNTESITHTDVCAADYSSNLDTFYYENTKGIPRYGIFQLSGLEWCDNGRHKSPNRCNISCDMFLDDDVTDDALCVKKVVASTLDMRAWPVYKKYCTRTMVNRYYLSCLFGRPVLSSQKKEGIQAKMASGWRRQIQESPEQRRLAPKSSKCLDSQEDF